MLMTYSTVFIGLFFSIILLLTLILDRGRFKLHTDPIIDCWRYFSSCFYLLMFLSTGFNLFEALQASIRKGQREIGNRIRND